MKINHNQVDSKGSFFITVDDNKLAEMTYSIAGSSMLIIDHTEVSQELAGQGIGLQLVMEAVKFARENNYKILPLCPFAKSVFQKKSEIADVLWR